jgi:hypothetical protein
MGVNCPFDLKLKVVIYILPPSSTSPMSLLSWCPCLMGQWGSAEIISYLKLDFIVVNNFRIDMSRVFNIVTVLLTFP